MTRIPGFWTVAELAAASGLSAGAIRWHCRNGNLSAIDDGRTWFIPAADAQRFLAARAARRG